MPMPWSVTDERDDVAVAADRDPDLPAVRAELDGVMDEVDHDLAETSLVAAHGGQIRLCLGDERDAAALGEETEALGGRGGELREVHVVPEVELGAALHPREVQHLVDHLRDVARLHLDQRDSLAHPGGHGGHLGLAGEGLGEQRDRGQRRPELVAQVVDELRADLLEPAKLRDILENHDEVGRSQPMRAHDEGAWLRGPGTVLHGGGAADGHGVERGLHANVQERLHDAPARQAPRDAEQGVGTLVGGGDPVIGADLKDADRQQVQGGIPGLFGIGARGGGCGHRRRGRRRGRHDAVQLIGPAADHQERGPQRDGQADDGDPGQPFHAAEDRTAEG